MLCEARGPLFLDGDGPGRSCEAVGPDLPDPSGRTTMTGLRRGGAASSST